MLVSMVLRQVVELRVALRELLVALVERVGDFGRKNRKVRVQNRAHVA